MKVSVLAASIPTKIPTCIIEGLTTRDTPAILHIRRTATAILPPHMGLTPDPPHTAIHHNNRLMRISNRNPAFHTINLNLESSTEVLPITPHFRQEPLLEVDLVEEAEEVTFQTYPGHLAMAQKVGIW